MKLKAVSAVADSFTASLDNTGSGNDWLGPWRTSIWSQDVDVLGLQYGQNSASLLLASPNQSPVWQRRSIRLGPDYSTLSPLRGSENEVLLDLLLMCSTVS
jgi:hypothetical protein